MGTMSRSRLPVGYAGFRFDFGALLRERRRELAIKQHALAEDMGISRESLSRIENGRSWPLPDTLDDLMAELDLTWEMIAVAGSSDRPHRPIDAKPRAAQRLDLGRDLRETRQRKGFTLRHLAESCGLSVAQLSRIERGQASRSKAFMDEPDDAAMPSQFRRLRFSHPELHRLSSLAD